LSTDLDEDLLLRSQLSGLLTGGSPQPAALTPLQALWVLLEETSRELLANSVVMADLLQLPRVRLSAAQAELAHAAQLEIPEVFPDELVELSGSARSINLRS
jgi:hypothetical protein